MKKFITTFVLLLTTAAAFAQETFNSCAQPNSVKIDIKHRGEYYIGGVFSDKFEMASETCSSVLSRPVIEIKHGVILSDMFYISAGVSMQVFMGSCIPKVPNTEKWNTIIFPVMINFKHFAPLKASVKPYVSASAGFPIVATSTLGNDLKGKSYIDVGIGVEYKTLLCEVGYQHNSLVLYEYDDTIGTTMKFGGIYLKFGLPFN